MELSKFPSILICKYKWYIMATEGYGDVYIKWSTYEKPAAMIIYVLIISAVLVISSSSRNTQKSMFDKWEKPLRVKEDYGFALLQIVQAREVNKDVENYFKGHIWQYLFKEVLNLHIFVPKLSQDIWVYTHDFRGGSVGQERVGKHTPIWKPTLGCI